MTALAPSPKKRGFALVIVIALLALTSAATVGLALAVGVRATQAAWVAADLDHELAVDSLVAVLPGLLASADKIEAHGGRERDEQFVELTVGTCEVRCLVRRGRPYLQVNALGTGDETRIRGLLSSLARDHGWPAETIALRPIVADQDTQALRAYLWFDQLIRPQSPGEIFPWLTEPTGKSPDGLKDTWSDAVSFWNEGPASARLHVLTRCDTTRRRWFLIVALFPSGTHCLYRGDV